MRDPDDVSASFSGGSALIPRRLVKNAEPELFELKVDGEKFAGEFLFVEVLNLSFTGPALPMPSPGSASPPRNRLEGLIEKRAQ